MNYHKYLAAIYGNLATSLWFFPYLSKLLHSIRGVKFKDRRSVFIGRDVIIDNRYPELVFIGHDVWLTARTVILTHSYSSHSQKKILDRKELIGAVIIEDGAFIGCGSIICPNVVVGENSYVAAGSVVTRNVPPSVLVAGNPAKIIKNFSFHQHEY
jgi:maltose O-acetyltransferase